MKLLTRAQFLELPEGVIYAKLPEPIVFDELCVKGETCRHTETGEAIDWWSMSLNDYDNKGDSNFYSEFQRLEAGESVPLNASWSRDGLFDETDRFLVYERADLEKLAQLVEAAKAVTP